MQSLPDYSGLSAIFLVIAIIVGLICVAIGITCYIFQGLGLYRIASRRGLANEAFWAWIPIGNLYLMGKIAEQSYSGVKLSLLAPLLVGIGAAVAFIPFIGIIGSLASLAGAVFLYISLYHIYKMLSPGHETLHLVLSVIVPCYSSIVLFVLRNR